LTSLAVISAMGGEEWKSRKGNNLQGEGQGTLP
jgi:hypothetical protein